MLREKLWVTAGMDHKPDKICKMCNGPCVPKNIGDICVKCIEEVPDHIPDAQVTKYLKVLLTITRLESLQA